MGVTFGHRCDLWPGLSRNGLSQLPQQTDLLRFHIGKDLEPEAHWRSSDRRKAGRGSGNHCDRDSNVIQRLTSDTDDSGFPQNLSDTTGYSKDGIWTFPEGAIWAKHFDYPTRWETFNRLIGGNFTEWLTNSNPNDGNDFYRATIRTGRTNISIDLPGLGNRGILVDTSTDLQNWMPWMVPGNDGIPLNPGAVHTLTGPITGPRGFFRFAIEEK